MSDVATNILSAVNEALEHIASEAMRPVPRVDAIRALAQTSLEDSLRRIQNLFASDKRKEAAKLSKDVSEMIVFADDLIAMLSVSKQDLIAELESCAENSDKIDAKYLRSVIDLVKKEKYEQAWKKMRGADTFVREGVASPYYFNLMHRSGKRADAIGSVLWNS